MIKIEQEPTLFCWKITVSNHSRFGTEQARGGFAMLIFQFLLPVLKGKHCGSCTSMGHTLHSLQPSIHISYWGLSDCCVIHPWSMLDGTF